MDVTRGQQRLILGLIALALAGYLLWDGDTLIAFIWAGLAVAVAWPCFRPRKEV